MISHRPDGGTGRRARLKIWWGQPRAGSTPALGTERLFPFLMMGRAFFFGKFSKQIFCKFFSTHSPYILSFESLRSLLPLIHITGTISGVRLIAPPTITSPVTTLTSEMPIETIRESSDLPAFMDRRLDWCEQKFGLRSAISLVNGLFRRRALPAPFSVFEKTRVVEKTVVSKKLEVPRSQIELPPVFGYSPHDLVSFYQSEIITWLNRLRAEKKAYGEEYHDIKETDEADELFFRKGMEHEREFLQHLKNSQKTVMEIPSFHDTPGMTFDKSFAATIKAMQDGPDVIYQAALRRDDISGYADFLIKRPNPIDPRTGERVRSKIAGLEFDYHYEVWDTKLSRVAKPTHVVQLCCYADMLEEIQGIRPHEIAIVTGTGKIETMKTNDYFYYYLQLKKMFAAAMREFDREQRPIVSKGDFGEWNDVLGYQLKEQDDLSLVAGLTNSQIKKLHDAGLKTLTDLSRCEAEKISGITPENLNRFVRQAFLQKASENLDQPLYEVNQMPRTDQLGLKDLPVPSEHDVFFDMEGFPLLENGLEYLFGATVKSLSGKIDFYSWWCENSEGEKENFEAFVDWIYVRWQQNRSMHVYHYAAYEVSAMLRLSSKHGTREKEILELLRHGVFVDLFRIVKNGLIVGTSNYSIKSIEKLYRSKRSGSVTSAVSSIVEFDRYLDTVDVEVREKIKDGIVNYNRDDCDSLMELYDYLRKICENHGIAPVQNSVEDFHEVTDLRRYDRSKSIPDKNTPELLNDLAKKFRTDLEQGEAKGLVLQVFMDILNFHLREDRVRLSGLMRRLDMTEDELFLDTEALAGLEELPNAVYDDKQSKIFTYRFDTEQNFSLKAEDKVVLAHNSRVTATVESIDSAEGLIKLRFGNRTLQKYANEPLSSLSIIPNEEVPPGNIHDSLYRQAEKIARTRQSMQPALEDLLYRKSPRIFANAQTEDDQKYRDGPIIRGDVYDYRKHGDDSELVQAIRCMDHTTLFIQGPPGSGKSTLSAHAILALVAKGKRIGISGPSHKSINTLLQKILDQAHEQGLDLKTAKIGEAEDHLKDLGVRVATSTTQFFENFDRKLQIVAGTPWAFSHPEADGKFDYLIVDEAGQVPLAHAVAMYPAAKNLIFVGDPEQLPMPNAAAHPRESGLSVFEYYLNDGSRRKTISDDRGIFLTKTFRMHPMIADFISQNFYEGRLKPSDNTRHHAIVQPSLIDSQNPLLRSGIFFVSVSHQDNARSSREEVQAVESLLKSLSDCLVQEVNEQGQVVTRSVQNDDFLIVSPYNAQVHLLKQTLASDIRVGTVDKFQGQEAHVTLISMASSQAHTSSRGLKFLMNPNRLNVAVSRAKSIVALIASPELVQTRAKSLNDWRLLNIMCQIMQGGDTA